MGQLSEAKQIENITKAQEALAKEVGIKDNPWFCYPYGDKMNSPMLLPRKQASK